MADVVQYRTERMANELDDLKRRGLFSRREIAEIVRRRRDFEFRLKRPSPLKQDFLDYIDYEKQVDSLRNLRKRAIIGKLAEKERAQEEADEGVNKNKARKKKKKSRKWKKSISDISGVRRILNIYRLATERFKADLDLWLKYHAFCREKKHRRMKQVLEQAIGYHPKVAELWIYAGEWEFDQNLNVSAARALMQIGLRTCPSSEVLWIECLRMELTYLYKLKARKVALGEDVELLQRNNSDADQCEEEHKRPFLPLNEEQGSSQEGSFEEREKLFLQQGASVFQTIYHGAINAIPSSLSLRQRFLDILDAVDLGHNDELKVEVMKDIRKDFSHDENYWDWIARLQIGDISNQTDIERSKFMAKLDNVVELSQQVMFTEEQTELVESAAEMLYDLIHVRYILTSKGMAAMLKTLKKYDFGRCPRVHCCGQPCLPVGQSDIPRYSSVKIYCPKCEDIYNAKNSIPAKMFSFYAKFLLDIMFPSGENTVDALSNPILDVQLLISYIINVFEKAESSGCVTADLACQYISFYLQIGRLNEAKDLARKLCKGKLSAAANLWILRISIEIKWYKNKYPLLSKEDMHSVFELFKDALTRLCISETEHLWLMALDEFSNHKEYFEKLVNVLMRALCKAGRSDTETSVSSSVVDRVLKREGIQKTREMYKRFLSLPHPSLKLFRHCIKLESDLGIAGDNTGIANARKLYDWALGIYPEDTELWRDYYVMEEEIGTPESANAVSWRAKKMLSAD